MGEDLRSSLHHGSDKVQDEEAKKSGEDRARVTTNLPADKAQADGVAPWTLARRATGNAEQLAGDGRPGYCPGFSVAIGS
jgi:hypothetical protein